MTDDMENENRPRRRGIEAEWDEKVGFFRRLRSKVKRRESLRLSIAEFSEAIETAKEWIRRLDGDRDRLDRKIETIQRDKTYVLHRSDDQGRRARVLAEKQKIVDSKKWSLTKRAKDLEIQNQRLDDLESELVSHAASIAEEEDQIRQLERRNEQLMVEIQEKTAQLECRTDSGPLLFE
jgi:chromosome segregation ATPase